MYDYFNSICFRRVFIYILSFILFCFSFSLHAQVNKFNSGYTPPIKSKKIGNKNLFGNDNGPLPSQFDLSTRMPPIGDQRSQSSCVGWAVAYGARSYYLGIQGEDIKNVKALPSPAYIYNQLNNDQTCSTGTYIHEALDIVKKQGVASLNDFPYLAKSCKTLPNDSIRSIAKKNAIDNWQEVRNDLGAIKRNLYEGHPVIIGMSIKESFQSLPYNKVYTDRAVISPSTTGHAMVIVGYDDGRSAFKIFNSWGTDWGDKGFGWVDYKTMLLRTHDFYKMGVNLENPQPQPQPKVVLPSPAEIKNISSQLPIISAGIDCGKVKGKVDKWGIVRLEGFIGKKNELDKVVQSILKLKGVRNVENQVRITPWPLCEAYLITEDLSPDKNNKFSTRVIGHPDNTLAKGDSLSIEMTLPPKPGYLYVGYLQSNGEAIKFYWTKSYTPSQTINLGGAGYKINDPIGSELIIALASEKPLFPKDEGSLKGDKQFLKDLRKIITELPATERAKINYSVTEVQTK